MEKYHGHAPWAPEVVSESCNLTNGDVRLVDLNFAVWKVLEVMLELKQTAIMTGLYQIYSDLMLFEELFQTKPTNRPNLPDGVRQI